jgi:hypothetical protein
MYTTLYKENKHTEMFNELTTFFCMFLDGVKINRLMRKMYLSKLKSSDHDDRE